MDFGREFEVDFVSLWKLFLKIMAYTQFKKIEQLRIAFGIHTQKTVWLPQVALHTAMSAILQQSLSEAMFEPLGSEKAKSELIVVPILKELRRNNNMCFSAFSGYSFEVDKAKGLTGFCDFILSASPLSTEIMTPIFCLVEAKKADIEEGIGQCGAEMYAAKLYNEREEKPRDVMYGCVTNAFSWCFLKLENNILYIDPNYVPLTFASPHQVLAVLQWILDESLK